MMYEVMASRRSVRRFLPDAPGRDVVERLVRAAITAPSAGNQQPWRFLAVTRRPVISALADAVRAAVDRIAPHVDAAFTEPLRRYSAYFSQFEGAPLVLVVLWRPLQLLASLVDDALPPADRGRLAELEERSALISASLALGNLLLAVHDEGLGACCMTGPLLADEDVRKLLPIPPSWRIAAFVPVGFPAEDPPATPRRPVEHVLTWIDDERSARGP